MKKAKGKPVINAGPNRLNGPRPESTSSNRSKNGIKLEKLIDRKAAPKTDFAGARKVLPKIKSNVERYDDALEGSLSDLLPKPPSEVRIFLSSTFSDYRSERNWLTRTAIPELREYCAENGLDFRVVDMRWGITDDATNEHVTETICQAEIANCKRVSLGPNFVAMLGDRFGYQPLPYAFVAKEFEILYNEAKEEGHPDVEALREWYKRDDNNVPPVYVIKPIRDVLPHFGDHTSGMEEARKKDTIIWNMKHSQLHDILRCAASSLANKSIITQSRKHDFFKSVTEMEVTDGILEAENPNQHALCYMRNFSGLTEDILTDENALRNIDGLKVDEKLILNKQVITYQSRLKNGHVPIKLRADNIRIYHVPWKEGGLSSEHKEHTQYLNKFCREFVTDTKRLINQALHHVSNIIPQSEYYTDLEEGLHHSHFCVAKCESFRGQEEPLGNIKTYLTNSKNRKPLMIYAESGVGKTSILAMAMKSVTQWFGAESISIIRFLGTSPQSGTLFDVLRGVMGQLADIFDCLLEPTCYKSNNRVTKKIITYFPRFLRNISRKTQKPIYIFLDSIDQLSPVDGAYSMQWLPTDLPPKINLILSVIPKHGGILDNTRKLLNDEKCFIQVKPLPTKTGNAIIDSHLSSRGRILTSDQRKVILKCLEKEPSPLFLKLFLDKALAWRSYTAVDEIRLETSVKQAITHLFEDLESKYGKFLISRALGYITIGLNGLSEVELEDVLSCDDAVLNEVYVYHDPPIEGVIRLPPLLWARIRVHINEYLAERRSQGKSTLSWYHRQFLETAVERYTHGNEGRILHRRLAELYLSENAVKKDITLQKRKGLVIKRADRQITVQPMTSKNKRMLEALPYHLLNARNTGYLKQVGLCNLKFLMTRMAGFSLDQVIKDITDNIDLLALEHSNQPDHELELLLSALKSARSSLRTSSQMPVELLARLKYDRKGYPNISNLLDKSKEHIEKQETAAILPLYPCLGDTSDIILSASIAEITSISDENTKIVLKIKAQLNDVSSKAVVFDAAAQKLLLEQTLGNTNELEPQVTRDGKRLIQVKVLEAASEKQVKDGRKKSKNDKEKVTKAAPKPGEYVIECMTLTQEGLTKGKAFALSEIKIKQLRKYATSPDGSMVAILFNDSDLAIYEIKTSKPLLIKSDALLQFAREVLWLGKDMCVILSENASGNSILFRVNIKDSAEIKIEVDGRLITRDNAMYIKEGMMSCISEKQTSRTLMFINLKSGQVVDMPLTSQGHINSMCSIENNTSLLMSTEKKLFTLDKSDPDSLKEVGSTGNQGVGNDTCITCNDEGTLLLVGDDTGSLKVFTKGDEVFTLSGNTKLHGTPIKELFLNEDEEILVSTAESGEVYIWNWRLIRMKCQTNQKSPAKSSGATSLRALADYQSASGVIFTKDMQNVITLSPVDGIKIWDLETHEKVKNLGQNVDPRTTLLACNGSIILALDKSSKKVRGWEVDTGIELDALKYLHGRIVALTKDPGSEDIYVLADIENKFCITVVDMIERKITQTFPLKERFENTDIELALTEGRDYLLFKVLTTPKQLEIINNSEKRSNLYSCKGLFVFYALDLKKNSGQLLPCHRQLTNIPCLGDSWTLQKGNLLIIGRERITLIWDIASGKCDQRLTKGSKVPQFYRPWWIEGDLNGNICHGTIRCMEKSIDGSVVAMGSDDGWFMMYDTETGGRLGSAVLKKTPQHQGPITNISLSPNGLWSASYGQDMTLRFWDGTDANREVANIKLGMKIHQMVFSKDNVTLAVLGAKGTGRSFVHLFRILPKSK